MLKCLDNLYRFSPVDVCTFEQIAMLLFCDIFPWFIFIIAAQLQAFLQESS